MPSLLSFPLARILACALSLTALITPTHLTAAEPFLEILPQPVLTGNIHLPGVLITEADTCLIIAQKRVTKGDFDPSDIVLTRSLDQGKTWSAPIKLHTSSSANPAEATGYSCMLVEDRTTTPHTILALYTTGPSPWKAPQLVWKARRSTDEGATWSEPYLVKNDGDPDSLPTNGGHGFQFPSGRLVIPGRKCFLTSDDHGQTWITRGKADPSDPIETVETKIVPLALAAPTAAASASAATATPVSASSPEGTEFNALYIIARKTLNYRTFSNQGETLLAQGSHGVAFTTKGRNPGLARHPAVPTPNVPTLLLMSGIPDVKGREFQITTSSDHGHTWSPPKKIADKAWYSDLGVTKDGTIIAAYTVNFSAALEVARFNVEWVGK